MIRTVLRRCDAALAAMCKWGVITALVVLFALLLMRIIARASAISFSQYDEIVELATVWMTLLGTLALWREGNLYRVEIVARALPRWGHLLEAVVHALMLAFALVLVVKGGDYAITAGEMTEFLEINKIYYYGAFPVCGSIMAIYSLVGMIKAFQGHQTLVVSMDQEI